MQINIAGFNVDKETLDELVNEKRDDITPETISAAYARISRDPTPVNELRKIAKREVKNARKSNKRIIFEMGHHSIAEHAVFNIDVIDLSRLAIEHLEHFRLASYTEKSQRYQKIENQFFIPPELNNSSYLNHYLRLLEESKSFYTRLYDTIFKFLKERDRDASQDPDELKKVDIMAKEDARYILPMSAYGQLGMTVNARTLELMMRRFSASSLTEIRELGNRLQEEISKIAPSLIPYSKTEDYDKKAYQNLKKIVDNFDVIFEKRKEVDINLVSYTEDADDKLLASIVHTLYKMSYQDTFSFIKKLACEDKVKIIKGAFSELHFYDAIIREFEHINLTYSIILSGGAFGQLKRHRMTSISCQEYDPSLSVTIPPLVYDVGLDGDFNSIIDRVNLLYVELNKEIPSVSQYILTNAHRKRLLMTLNMRELYHISRLREDMHAQWDIRNIVKKMTTQAEEKMPLATLLIGGKDTFSQKYQKLFG